MKRTCLRIAAVLLALALLCACGKKSATDTPRETRYKDPVANVMNQAARWGVLLQGEPAQSSSASYQKRYRDGCSLTVQQAPGWYYSTADTVCFTAIVQGTAEEDLLCSVRLENLQEPFLRAGTYADPSKLTLKSDGSYQSGGTFEAADYYPICWDLTVKDPSGKARSLSDLARIHRYGSSGFSLRDPAEREALTTCLEDLASMVESICPGFREAKLALDPETGALELTGRIDKGAAVDLQLELSWKWCSYDAADPGADNARSAEKLLRVLAAGSLSAEEAGCADPDRCCAFLNADAVLSLQTAAEAD